MEPRRDVKPAVPDVSVHAYGHRRKVQQARAEGFLEALSNYLPKFEAQYDREQDEVWRETVGGILRAFEVGDNKTIQALTPLFRALQADRKYLMDRALGGVIQRAQVESRSVVQKNVVSMTLRELAEQEARVAEIVGDDVVDGDVVEGEVVEDESGRDWL